MLNLKYIFMFKYRNLGVCMQICVDENRSSSDINISFWDLLFKLSPGGCTNRAVDALCLAT